MVASLSASVAYLPFGLDGISSLYCAKGCDGYRANSTSRIRVPSFAWGTNAWQGKAEKIASLQPSSQRDQLQVLSAKHCVCE